MWTRRCQYYFVGKDILTPWRQSFVSFKADLRLMTLCTGLENSDMMVSCMFAKESWGVAIVSKSSAVLDNTNRMAFFNVKNYGLLLQNLVTHEAVKNVAFVMNLFYMPNYCSVCCRITLSCDILCFTKKSFFF